MNQENHTILIVDDSATNLSVLFDYLRNTGFKVLQSSKDEIAAIRRTP